MRAALVLASGAARARILARAGGRVTALSLAGPDGVAVELLHPYPEDHADPVRWAKGGIYPLAPFSNRIANACVRVGDVDHRLAPHPDALPHALHGHAHLRPWRLVSQAADRAVLALESAAGDAWPWAFGAELDYRLEASCLHARLTITNSDRRPMPAGIGLHPYFRHPPQSPVAFAAATIWEQDRDGLATRPRPSRADERFDPARALPEGGLTWYGSGWSGVATTALGAGLQARIDADPVFAHLVVHRPESGAYLCLEPVSHVADGFNLAARGVPATGTVLLQPGGSLAGSTRFRLTTIPPC